MAVSNPFGLFRIECQSALESALKKIFPKIHITSLAIKRPPDPHFGQLASSVCFGLAKQEGDNPAELAERLVKTIDISKASTIKHVDSAGGGYVNFHMNFKNFSTLTLDLIRELDSRYGFVQTERPVKIIVEHTSVNPLHPIHIGQARNPILGDTVVRLLRSIGHTVRSHYYVDDVGRQSSVIAYGYEKLGRPKPRGKPDQFIGKIYAITSCLVEICRLKRIASRAQAVSLEEELTETTRELDDWMSAAAELQSRHPRLFERLLSAIDRDEDPEKAIGALNKAYEAGDSKAVQLVKEVSNLCLDGFKETLHRAGVHYDSWDWESDLTVRSGRVAEVLQGLTESSYTFEKNGVLEFDAEKAIEKFGAKEKFDLGEKHEIPTLTLVRTDGTTLYPTRDIAYTLWKFERADKVVNVIGMEQNLAQLQLKIALLALGYRKYVDNLTHFGYNLVSLPEYKMTGRRGRYVTFDEVMDEAVKRAYEEVSKRSPQLTKEEKQEISTFVGIGAVRYALVEIDSSKPVIFTWDRVLNFERNSSPYIQYTHARACSILRKAAREPARPAYELLKERLENELVIELASLPDTLTEAVEYLKPSMIPAYAAALSDTFNTFYGKLPVIKANPLELGDARLILTDAVRIVLRNSLNLIGIFAPERM